VLLRAGLTVLVIQYRGILKRTEEYRVAGRAASLPGRVDGRRSRRGSSYSAIPMRLTNTPPPAPTLLSGNGTFMVYRKLHQNVAKFERLLDAHAESFPGGRELLAAKLSGRWRDNGAPIVNTDAASRMGPAICRCGRERTRDRMLADFRFDLMGDKCPIGPD
jgi:hypothetical protein